MIISYVYAILSHDLHSYHGYEQVDNLVPTEKPHH